MSKHMLRFAGAASLLAIWVGCKPSERQQTASPPAEQAALPADVQLAVTIARAIDAAPGKEDSILAAHSLTRAGLDSLMYAIAADSTKAAAYTAARP